MKSNPESKQFMPVLRCCALLLCLSLSGCVSVIAGAVVDTTIEVAKVPFKIAGAVVDLAIPDDDDED